MNTRFSRFFLAGGHNAVPVSGWFFGGWSPGTTLAIFWIENLVLTVFIASRVAVHWTATRKRGHEDGFLKNFLVTSLVFTVAHGIFLGFILGTMMPASVNRDDLVRGVQWMLGAQVASLLLDLWSIQRWPFAEIRARTDWMLGRVIAVHLSILLGMFLFMAIGQPWWFFSVFVAMKALIDIGSVLPKWQYQPAKPPTWMARGANWMDNKTGHRQRSKETFEAFWARTNRMEAAKRARDEEVVDA
jgi:hypothetical protein